MHAFASKQSRHVLFSQGKKRREKSLVLSLFLKVDREGKLGHQLSRVSCGEWAALPSMWIEVSDGSQHPRRGEDQLTNKTVPAVILTRTWGTRPRTQHTRPRPRPQKNNCLRPRTNITDYESTNPCRRPADLIGTTAPFAIFISYLFFNISIIDLENRWGQLCRTFAASRLGGWNKTSLSQSPKIPLRGSKGQKRAKHSTDLVVCNCGRQACARPHRHL